MEHRPSNPFKVCLSHSLLQLSFIFFSYSLSVSLSICLFFFSSSLVLAFLYLFCLSLYLFVSLSIYFCLSLSSFIFSFLGIMYTCTVALILRTCRTWWLAKLVVGTSPSRVMGGLCTVWQMAVIHEVNWRPQNTPGPVMLYSEFVFGVYVPGHWRRL